MRAGWMVFGLCLLGCDGGQRFPGEAPVATAEPAPTAVVEPRPVETAAPASAARRYRDAAMAAAHADFEQQMAGCAEAEDMAACETSAAVTLDAAEQAVRLEYEARLLEEMARPDGG
jgi:hypothetical protein